LRYVPAPGTMFAGIRALPPGHTMTCGRNGVEIRRYWQLKFTEQKHATEEAYTEQLDALLRESIHLHLAADVPFGAFLSGGVDSSTIVALMSLELNRPVKTFSVGFESGATEGQSELPFARLVAKKFETDHYEFIIRPHHVENVAQKAIWHLDQPIADEANIANLLLSELAASQVKMVLTGEGGDELFAGYARHVGERWSPFFGVVPNHAKSAALRLSGRLPGLRRPKLALFALCQSTEARRLASWFPLFNGAMKQRLLTDDLMREMADPFSEEVFAEHLAQSDTAHWLNRMLYVDTKLWLADDLLARGDKMSMAASLEARVPLLDHKLVEFAASLPPGMKLNKLTRKYLLKKVARQWLPAEVIDRKKQGFSMPFSGWFRKELRPFARDLLSPVALKRRGLFNPEFVTTMLDEHESGVANHGGLIWGLISLELWHQAFLAPARAAVGDSMGLRS
jgi:asparagine synthase (glutamine-hydrolysing)